MERQRRSAAGLEGFDTADGMFTVDGDQMVIQWNSAAERILGLKASEVMGRTCFEALGGPASFCHERCPVVSNAMRGKLTPAANVSLVCAGGEARCFNLSTLVADGPGEIRIVHLVREPAQADGYGRPAREPAPESQGRVNGNVTKDTPKLSPREAEALEMLSRGLDTDEIAREMGVRRVTARNHIGRLLARLGAQTRLQAVVAGIGYGLVSGGEQGLVREHLSGGQG